MFNKKKEKQNNNSLYSHLSPMDAQYFSQLDESIALAQKKNNKNFYEFLIDKKQFDMNYIKVKDDNKIGKIDLLPTSLLSILNNRDNEKLFEKYKKDTMQVANILFDSNMTIQEICATACEFVRLSTSTFDRYDSESVQNPQSALCGLLSTNVYGMLSFYFGVSNSVDRTQLVAWLINAGLDIKHSLSYAECLIDAYGKPVCHIVDFSGKMGVSFVDYVGVANAYTKKIESLAGLCDFLDFTKEIENGKKRALKLLTKSVPSKLMVKNSNLEKALTTMTQMAYQKMSDITPCDMNMLSSFDGKIWKFSTLCELLLFANNAEYEVVLDLFDENQYSLKLKLNSNSNEKFKVFPNKVIDEEYKLNEPKIYILNKLNNQTALSPEDDFFNEQLENIGRDNSAKDEFSFDDFEISNNTQSKQSEFSFDNFENFEPMPASDVLDNLNLHFTPKENESLSFENGQFKFTDDDMNELFDLSNTTQVDFDKADAEQKILEQSIGKQPTKKEEAKHKDFFELLNEMTEKVKENKTRRLKEEYEKLEKNHELKTLEKIPPQQNVDVANVLETQSQYDFELDDKPIKNDENILINENSIENSDNAEIDNLLAFFNNIPTQNDSLPTQNEASPTQENTATQTESLENYDNIFDFNQDFNNQENELNEIIDNDIQLDEINPLSEINTLDNIDTNKINTIDEVNALDDLDTSNENDESYSIYDDLMQFSDYNYNPNELSGENLDLSTTSKEQPTTKVDTDAQSVHAELPKRAKAPAKAQANFAPSIPRRKPAPKIPKRKK